MASPTGSSVQSKTLNSGLRGGPYRGEWPRQCCHSEPVETRQARSLAVLLRHVAAPLSLTTPKAGKMPRRPEQLLNGWCG
jgi:hypothetical protein